MEGVGERGEGVSLRVCCREGGRKRGGGKLTSVWLKRREQEGEGRVAHLALESSTSAEKVRGSRRAPSETFA